MLNFVCKTSSYNISLRRPLAPRKSDLPVFASWPLFSSAIRTTRRRECPLLPAGSTGRRNTLAKSLGWGLEVQCFPWPFVEFTRHAVEMGLGVRRQIGSVREVLPQQPVGVFVGSALPRALRIAEIDGDVGFHGEALMIGEFFASIPGQRFVQFVREFACLLDQGVDYGFGFPVGDLGEHHIA